MSRDDPNDENEYYGDDRDDPYSGDVYRADAEYERRPQYEASDEGEWLGMGTGVLLILAGVGLILFPEPATSTLGFVLVVVGLVVWGYGALT